MRTMGLLFLLVCAISFSVPARAAENEAAMAIRALENKWVEAQSHGDNRALDLMFDNALVYIEEGKAMTKADYLLRVRLGRLRPPQIASEVTTVRTFGNTAIVLGTYRETIMKNGKTMVRRWRFVDTWVKKAGNWMLVAAGASPIT
jgi:ketosteroid isomerase-like protein